MVTSYSALVKKGEHYLHVEKAYEGDFSVKSVFDWLEKYIISGYFRLNVGSYKYLTNHNNTFFMFIFKNW